MADKTLEFRISKAKTNLILDHPFVGTIAMNMPLEVTDQIPTAATNGKKIMVNPTFCEDLTDNQLLFLIAHECFHPMLEHIWRLNGRDPQRWNIAGDVVINQLLTNEGIGEFIEGGMLDPDLYAQGEGITDKIYNLLPESAGGSGQGQGGIGADIMPDDSGDPAEAEQAAQDMRTTVAQAAQAAKMMGKLSGGMERLVGELLQPRVDWRDVLQDFIGRAKTDSRTFARPARRWASQGLYMPTISGEAMPPILIAVDCSGSVTAAQIDQFAAEIRAVQSDTHPEAIHVAYFDTQVCHYDHFAADEPVQCSPHGGGGTAYSPIWQFALDNGIEPAACVVLTDLYCSDYGQPPEYPVLWVSTEGRVPEVPFGTVVRM